MYKRWIYNRESLAVKEKIVETFLALRQKLGDEFRVKFEMKGYRIPYGE